RLESVCRGRSPPAPALSRVGARAVDAAVAGRRRGARSDIALRGVDTARRRRRSHRCGDSLPPPAEVVVEETAAPEYDLAAIPDHIKAAAKRYRLSEELITAVIAVESNFDHAAVSQKGARGLMQLMPQTS